MVTKEQILDRIQTWTGSVSKKSYIRCFDLFSGEHSEELVFALLVMDSVKDIIPLCDQLRDDLRTLSEDILVYRVDSHSHTTLRLLVDQYKAEIVLGCVPSSQVPKDEELSHFLNSAQTGLKPSRDAALLKQLLIPRLWAWFETRMEELDPSVVESFRSAYKSLVKWAQSRGVLGDGLFTRETLVVMLCSISTTDSVSAFELMRKFFRRFAAEFEWNEASVAAHVCGLTGTAEDGYYGSVINEEEGIDSDVDDELRNMRLARKIPEREPDESGGETHSQLATNANENDDVHPHKRLRFELGQIRDIRRFYAVENTCVEKITCSGNKRFNNYLDFLDVLTVCHPSPGYDLAEGDHVNIALRTLESHKKLMVQELVRANMIVSDCVGDDFETVFQVLGDEKIEREIHLFCNYEINGESQEIISLVSSIFQDQIWFLVQELQANHGVMVVPLCLKNSPVSVGLIFVKDEPYGATEGSEIDLLGPMSRVMLRCKKILKERSDYEEKLRGKFIVRSRVVRNR